MSQLDSCLGLPQELKCFGDGKARTAYPVKMRQFSKFLDSVSRVNTKVLWTNFLFEDVQEHLEFVLKVSFQDEETLEGLLDIIDAGNFPEIMKAILDMNGLDFSGLEGEEGKNEKEV